MRYRTGPIDRCAPVARAAPSAVLRLRSTRGRALRRTRFPTAAVADAYGRGLRRRRMLDAIATAVR